MKLPWRRPEPEGGRLPRVGRSVLVRGLIAFVLVVSLSATAMASAVLFEVDDVKTTFLRASGGEQIDIPEISKAEAGGARTFLILGSDIRFAERHDKNAARSDTILLVRVDPRRNRIAVLSIPRDLAVTIPGHGVAKINEAYTDGGAPLSVKTIQELFESRIGKKLNITNVVNVTFGGFQRAVNYIGGVYVDVDRRYYNDNSSGAPGGFSSIDIQPGYQKLKGSDALAYVRYRHTDSDIYRAARQQDFLRQLTAQGGVRKLLDFGKRKSLARIFGSYFQVDKSFRSTKNILSLLKTGIFLASKNAPVNEVRFPALDSSDPTVDTNLSVSDAGLQRVYREFITGKGSTNPRSSSKATEADKKFSRSKSKKTKKSRISGLVDARSQGRTMAVLADPKLDFPFYFPALRTTGSSYADDQARVYKVKDEQGKNHDAYRLVLYDGKPGEYYGVQGTTWRNPPLLLSPDRTTTSDSGRKLNLFYDGSHVRLVSWQTDRGTYWVTNTLSQDISNSRLIAIAGSLSRLNQ